MRMVYCVTVAFATLCSASAQPVIRTAHELTDVVRANVSIDRPFVIEGEVISPKVCTANALVVRDQTGAVPLCDMVHAVCSQDIRAGYRVRIAGRTELGYNYLDAAFTNVEVIAKSDPSPHPDIRLSPTDLLDGTYDFRHTRLVGTVRDVFDDEADAKFVYLLVGDMSNAIYVTSHLNDRKTRDFNLLIGCEVEIEGIVLPHTRGMRHYIGRTFEADRYEDFHLLRKSDDGIFSAPPLEMRHDLQPAEIATLGRRRLVGRVTALWNGSRIMLETGFRRMSFMVDLADTATPSVGDAIEVVGFPSTDLYRIHLRHARWRHAQTDFKPSASPSKIKVHELMRDREGHARIDAGFFGKLVTLSGTVIGLPVTGNVHRRMYLRSDGHILPVDIGACAHAVADLSPGCTAEVTGILVMEAENWQPDSIFPSTKDIFVVTRNNDDVRLLMRPSWWTAQRLLFVIGALVLVLSAILVWNTSLRRLAERRGRELADEQVNRAVSDLKVYERTHLAVELHDSLSQTLSGVSMQIDAVGRFADTDRERMRKHLGIASKTLKSCRDELRNCLSDLRSNALEERDMNEAIRQTLEPYSDDAAISIRFFIPREILSDSTTHTILRVIRELVVNAIRHGHADKVKVAGALEDGKLRFSVMDNGCGFDTESSPGLAEGHFGLQGIRERVDGLDGNFEIESKAGHGSKATVSIHLPEELNEEKS